MKQVVKNFIRKYKWSVVNTKYRWGIDIFSDLDKIFAGKNIHTILDVGANEGVFASEILSAFPGIKLYAIEPGSSAYTVLHKRFSKNQLVKCDRYAVGEAKGKSVLYTFKDSKKNTVKPLLLDEMRTGDGTPEDIEMTTLDDYAEKFKINEIDFLKIDVEGNEMAVLKGAAGLLHDNKIKTIFCEFHKILAFENNESPHTSLASMVEFLEGFRLRFVALFTQGVHFHEDLVTCNVLFAHKDLLKNRINNKPGVIKNFQCL